MAVSLGIPPDQECREESFRKCSNAEDAHRREFPRPGARQKHETEGLSNFPRPRFIHESPMLKRLTFNRVDPVSAGKVLGVLHLAYGLFIGVIYAMMGLAMAAGGGINAGMGLAIAGASLMILPVILGIFGFLAGMLLALFYNLAASYIGGLVVEVEDESEDDED